MDVEHRLPRLGIGVEHGAIATLGVAVVLGELRGAAQHGSGKCVVTGTKLVQVRDVLARHHERAQRRAARTRCAVEELEPRVLLAEAAALAAPPHLDFAHTHTSAPLLPASRKASVGPARTAGSDPPMVQ